MIWHFMGRPSSKDVQDAWNDFGGFGDFSDVLKYVFRNRLWCVCMWMYVCERIST